VRDDGNRWDDRYQATTPVEPRRPEALERWPELDGLLPTDGRALDIASGPGSVTLWLAERGLEVTALDVSGVAIDLLRNAAGTHGLADRIDTQVADLDDGLPIDVIDRDLIVCQRFRDAALSTVMIDRLRRGGYAVVTVLSAVGAQHPGTFHAPPNALLDEFGADDRCDVLRHDESDGVAHIVIRRR
jgi:SAM-dependent methyltransferase